MTTATREPYAEARAQAAQAFATHQMTVLHEDGVYRHLRFSRPKTWMYGFDLVTWPGCLYVGGDLESFTFARVADMTEFFTSGPVPYDINPGYWAEKITNRSTRTRSYARRLLDERVTEAIGEDDALRKAWEEHLRYEEDYVLEEEQLARQVLASFEFERSWPFADSSEWELREWDHHYLLSCFAVVHGLAIWKERVS